MAIIHAPENKLVLVINTILDFLIKGLGVEAAIAAAVAQVPWLGLPVVNWILRQIVGAIAQSLDTQIKINLDNILIRFQDDVRKIEYDDSIDQLKKAISQPGVSDADKAKAIQDAKDSLDRIIHRAK